MKTKQTFRSYYGDQMFLIFPFNYCCRVLKTSCPASFVKQGNAGARAVGCTVTPPPPPGEVGSGLSCVLLRPPARTIIY